MTNTQTTTPTEAPATLKNGTPLAGLQVTLPDGRKAQVPTRSYERAVRITLKMGGHAGHADATIMIVTPGVVMLTPDRAANPAMYYHATMTDGTIIEGDIFHV